MKILVIGNGNITKKNGVVFTNNNTGSFCEKLVDSGCQVSYLQFFKYGNDNDNLLNYQLRDDIGHYSVNLKSGYAKIYSYLTMIMLIIRVVRTHDFIYIFYPGHLPLLASFIAWLLKVPYGLYVRGEVDIDKPYVKRNIEKADFILTVSEVLKITLEQLNDKVSMIAPMMSFSKQHILEDREYRQNGVIRCLYVGRIERRKGIIELLDAIRMLSEKFSELEFHLVGGGECFDQVKKRFENDSSVVVYGLVSDSDELLKIYRSADMFVFPSHDEGFPRVLYEAMMARVPICTTMVGGISGVMQNGRNCLEIEVNNPDSIVEKVSELVNSPELCESLVLSGVADMKRILSGDLKPHHECLLKEVAFV